MTWVSAKESTPPGRKLTIFHIALSWRMSWVINKRVGSSSHWLSGIDQRLDVIFIGVRKRLGISTPSTFIIALRISGKRTVVRNWLRGRPVTAGGIKITAGWQLCTGRSTSAPTPLQR